MAGLVKRTFQMIEVDEDQNIRKNAFEELRRSRNKEISEISKRVKEQRKTVQAIAESLKDRAATVPEIAQVTGIPTDKILWYIATLKKYGKITEAEKVDGYYRYDLSEGRSDASIS
jgi:predicted Rossmann fold nucleotide-binding protein DprA/Smf involved in DNA uptake